MSVHGKYLLRSIQNESLPTLDLLIRECVQNSLDASLSDDTSYKVKVDCIVRECDCRALNKVFEGISEELDKRYGDKKNIEFIAIRDSGTTGLTGPLREKDIDSAKNFGNLRKLVYEFGQCQENIGKGGSWGIGKTVCFRVGNGIVLYYSRIQVEDGTYQERLAAALVEDETGKNPLLKNSYTNGAPTGICWWGDTDPVDYSSMPLTDEKEIHKVIDIFGIQPYRNDETGTCIIIPYIDSKALLENADAEYEAHGDTMGSMLKKIAQRWYFPRINNSHYPYGCQLNFMVNQLPIKEAETHTFFQYMQELYNYSADVIQKPRTKLPAEIHCSEISLRNEFTQSGKAGVVLWREVTNQDLEMCIPNNEPSPYGLINKPDEKDEDGKLIFTHNPFSMPQGEMDALLNEDPLKIKAYQYDIVCNGVELSSGAVRNHDIDIMKKAFEIAGYDEEVLKEKFGALYTAFQFGAPPHAGMAPGIDRMIMLLRNEDNIREIIAFPMDGKAQDLMCGAPNEITEQQLREVHIKLRK